MSPPKTSSKPTPRILLSRGTWPLLGVPLAALVLAGCPVDLGVEGKLFGCATSADCLAGFECAPSGNEPGQSVCKAIGGSDDAGGTDSVDTVDTVDGAGQDVDTGVDTGPVDSDAPDLDDAPDSDDLGDTDTFVPDADDAAPDTDDTVPDANDSGDAPDGNDSDVPDPGCPPFTEAGEPLGGPCGLGVCAGGIVICKDDETVCSTGGDTAPELCNDLDDDCDGLVDEDFDVGSGCDGDDPDDCDNGVITCASTTSTTCVEFGEVSEVCDGLDNDCDGQTDEDFNTLGSGCDGADADLCANGVYVCSADSAGVVCDETGANVVELCDGVDNDCDGMTDEDFGVGAACDGTDADLCANGNVVCGTSTTTLCDENPSGSIEEVCDGVDNDCDGSTDEDFAVGDACDGNDSDLCENGVFECASGGSSVVCSELVTNIVELCDGVDNDCDGSTDEDYPTLNTACDSNDSDLCANGFRSCTSNGTGTECLASNESIANIPEVCDGFDNDCDGAADEDFVDLGQVCDGPDADQCTDGIYTCAPSGQQTICNDDPQSTAEVCDGLDNDCDGTPDNNIPITAPLYVGDATAVAGDECGIGKCIGGLAVCAGLGVECSTDNLATPEICNGLDDDCDGTVDEQCGSNCPGVGITCPSNVLCAGGCIDANERVFIPGGSFMMGCTQGTDANCGSDAPAHEVRLSPFYIDRFEVSCADRGQTCSPADRAAKIGWSTLTSECSLRGGQLCTEAQWEFAARATLVDGAPGPSRKFPWGSQDASCASPDLASHWQFAMNTGCDTGECGSVAAFTGGASFFGVLNMAGNVAEWTAEGYEASFYVNAPLANPHNPVTGGLERVMRGGAYNDFSVGLVTYLRDPTAAVGTSYTGGRCCYDF